MILKCCLMLLNSFVYDFESCLMSLNSFLMIVREPAVIRVGFKRVFMLCVVMLLLYAWFLNDSV